MPFLFSSAPSPVLMYPCVFVRPAESYCLDWIENEYKSLLDVAMKITLTHYWFTSDCDDHFELFSHDLE